METKGIRILDLKDGLVIADLPDILNELANGEQFHWSILNFYGTGDLGEGKSIDEFEDYIDNSPNGLPIVWEQLNHLARRLIDVMDILIIGCKEKAHLRKFDSDQEMYEACDFVIHMFDSTFWQIYTKDEKFLTKISTKFEIVKAITVLDRASDGDPSPHQHLYKDCSRRNFRKRGAAELMPNWDYANSKWA